MSADTLEDSKFFDKDLHKRPVLTEDEGWKMTQEEKEASPVGLRYNQGKRKWSLVDFASLEPMIEVLEYGANKYTAHNWKKGLPKKEILESMMRHIAKLMDGEENDKETGISHMGHIQCNALFYNYMVRNNLGD